MTAQSGLEVVLLLQGDTAAGVILCRFGQLQELQDMDAEWLNKGTVIACATGRLIRSRC